ncbi:MAG: hypothetical protein GX939_04800 [Clostridiaceae bacterium]|nr:hypothetical protein [Clostridiaceae bacterium]
MNQNQTKNTYIGITIGPIYDTIRQSSTPAALWASSYIFSHSAKRICEKISKKIEGGEKAIVSPFFESSNPLLSKDDGIGLFHDRVIFETHNPGEDLKTVKSVLVEVKDEIAKLFGQDHESWFQKYLQFHAVVFDAKNPLLDSSKYLDAIELRKGFPETERQNPLISVLDADNNNQLIRDFIKKGLNLPDWPLSMGYDEYRNKQPDMEFIVGKEAEIKRHPQKPEKSYSYYAIVQSDGDKIGDYIKECEDPKTFSKKCLEFCSKAATAIQDYGGVTIYAGGDDLLFIAPLWERPNETRDVRRNILQLIRDLQKTFKNSFEEKKPSTPETEESPAPETEESTILETEESPTPETKKPPTLSFGVAIRYYKFPLYEAFDKTYELLFHEAKVNRDACAISLRKHSGQSAEFVIENLSKKTSMSSLISIIENSKQDVILNSVQSTLWKFRKLLSIAIGKALNTGETLFIENIFDNIFDSEIHDKYSSRIDQARDLLIEMIDTHVKENGRESKKDVPEIDVPEEYSSKKDGPKIENEEDNKVIKFIYALDAQLRFVRFFSETGMEERDA